MFVDENGTNIFLYYSIVWNFSFLWYVISKDVYQNVIVAYLNYYFNDDLSNIQIIRYSNFIGYNKFFSFIVSG